MKTNLFLLRLGLAALLVACPCLAAFAQSTAFAYQGRLQHGGSPANGLCEMTFTLYDAVTNGALAGAQWPGPLALARLTTSTHGARQVQVAPIGEISRIRGCPSEESGLNVRPSVNLSDLDAMPTLTTTVDGLKLPNPFVIASGPPGTNLNVIARAFQEGWGAVIAKTVSLDASKVINVTPRYAKLLANSGEVIGWENIELISDRPIAHWIEEFKKCKEQFPDRVLIASVMEEYRKDAWVEIIERCQTAGVDAFELNFSCPHGLPERKMGAAMGENPEILLEVVGWVMSAARKPVWAKMTPNVTHIEDPGRAALRGGATGLSAINTIRSVMSVNLDTLRPEPAVEGHTTPGGYSSKAVRPIALRMVMELAQMIRKEFPGRSLSGIGGIENGNDAAQFILLGADTVQVCTGVMKFGYECVKPMCDELLAFMARHRFETLADFKGKSLDYFTTHADLVRRQTERKAAQKAAADARKVVKSDAEWTGGDFVKQSDALAR